MEFDETLRFWCPRVVFNAWIGFAFCPMKTYGPISVDLREKRRKKTNKISLSLSLSLSLSNALPLPFIFLLFFFILVFIFFINIIIIVWIYGSYCLIQVRFCSETIYLILVHFILNELSSSHFLTSDIFLKISSLNSLATYLPENRKNIPLVSEFDKNFLSH